MRTAPLLVAILLLALLLDLFPVRTTAGSGTLPPAAPRPARPAGDPGDESWSDGFAGGGIAGGEVFALAWFGNELYVGGGFDTVGAASFTSNIARWDGAVWRSLRTGLDERVNALAAGPSELYVGGAFSSPAGVAGGDHLIRWQPSNWYSLGAQLPGGSPPFVLALALGPGGELYVGGSFSEIGGINARNIARYQSGAWSPLGSGVNGVVRALAVAPSGDLYAGGSFSEAGGSPAAAVARWNGSTWSPLGAGVDGSVSSLAVAPVGDLYVGGTFTQAGSVAASNVARWGGGAWSALGAGTNNQVSALAVHASGLYAGGRFTQAGGTPASGIARWDGGAWSALGSGVSGPSRVNTLLVQGDVLYVGGRFIQAGGKTNNSLATWQLPAGTTPTPTPTAMAPATPSATPTPTASSTPTELPTATASSTPTATPQPTPTETGTPTPTPTETGTPTPTATWTPSATPTESPTSTTTPTEPPASTATPTETPAPTATQTPAETGTPTPTGTATPVPTATPTDTPGPTPTGTATGTPTPTRTATTPGATPSPTGTPTPNPTETPTPAPSTTPTATPTGTPTPAPTVTPSPSATPTPAPTDTATPTLTPRPTETGTPTPSVTPSPTAVTTPTPSATPPATETATPAPTPTSTATATAQSTPTATITPQPTPTATASPTGTSTPRPTETSSPTSTATATASSTPTATGTPTGTPTATASATGTATPTNTPTTPPTHTPTGTPTIATTPTQSPTHTPTTSATVTRSPTWTATPLATPSRTPTTGTFATATPTPGTTSTPTTVASTTPSPTPTAGSGCAGTPIGPAGGTVHFTGAVVEGEPTGLTLVFAAGSFRDEVCVSVAAEPEARVGPRGRRTGRPGRSDSVYQLVGPVYRVEARARSAMPVDLLASPAVIALHYAAGQLGGMDEATLLVARLDEPGGVPELLDRVPTGAARSVGATIDRLGLFTLAGEPSGTIPATPTPAAPSPGTGLGRLQLITPVRIVDTRRAFGPVVDTYARQRAAAAARAGRGDPFTPGELRRYHLAGETINGVEFPADLSGLMLNVTIVQPEPSGGYVTVFPGDLTRPPNASTLNPSTGIAANFWTTAVPLGGPYAGTVAVYSSNALDVVLDVVGIYTAGSPGSAEASGTRARPGNGPRVGGSPGELHLVMPVRAVDTRTGDGGPLQPGVVRRFPLAGRSFGSVVVPRQATGILAHITTVQPAGSGGYVAAFPADLDRPPGTSTVNPSTAIAFNTFVSALPASGPHPGALGVYSTNRLDVVIDILGYWLPEGDDAPPGAGAVSPGALTLIPPVRVVDTRGTDGGPIGFDADGRPLQAAPLDAGTTRRFRVAGHRFPGGALPAEVRGVLVNVTIVQASPSGGYVTLFPGDLPDHGRPFVSTLNPSTAIAASFWAVAVPGTPSVHPGTLAVFSTNALDVIVDVVGYYR